MRHLLCLFVAATVLTAAEPVPRGDRVLAIDVSMAEDQPSYDAAWAQAVASGIQSVGLSLDWNQLEGAPGVFTDPNGVLAAANAYYPAVGASVVLTLRPLHNSVKPVPADLAATPFEDGPQTMATRFCALVDWVMTQLPAVTFEALVIGSEYDVHLGADGAAWSDYGWFMSRVITHIRAAPYSARIPRLAAEATFAGYVNQPAGITAINNLCDVAGVSYYAIGGGFDVKDAAAIRADLDSLLPFASAAKPLCFYQFGCPSAWTDGTSTVHDRSAAQATFIETAFAFWDANPDTVRLLDFTWLHDQSPAFLAEQSAYFGSADPSFLGFLASLGLRTWPGDGTAKLAYTTLQTQAYVRGWGEPLPSGGGGGDGAPSGGGGGGCGAGMALSMLLATGGYLHLRRRRSLLERSRSLR